ncbi:MAG: serine/threonine protein kinase [Planctomycetota bacterium]|nr:MAG: serine/threonine protein kinase [Planctomycetota bacterium]
MGSVFRCHPLAEGGQDRAIKFLAPELIGDAEMCSRFRREGRLCNQLQHPHLVAVYEHGSHQGCPYLVMDLIAGASLDRILDKSGALDWRKAVSVAAQIADVLAYLQSQGVVHRDIKPENMLIDSRQRVTLIDLGFAKVRGESDERQSGAHESQQLTMAGTALGSPAYMAPEQILDAMNATHATDCYCLGASLYHMLTGKLPYDGSNAMQVMQLVLQGECPPVRALQPSLPASLDALVAWMMRADPAQRPAELSQVHGLLKRIHQNPQDCQGLPVTRVRRWRWLLVLLALILAGLAGVYALVLKG